jgi:hypothetical protein
MEQPDVFIKIFGPGVQISKQQTGRSGKNIHCRACPERIKKLTPAASEKGMSGNNSFDGRQGLGKYRPIPSDRI